MTISVMGIDWGFGAVSNSQMEQYWEEKMDVDLDIEWVSYRIMIRSEYFDRGRQPAGCHSDQ